MQFFLHSQQRRRPQRQSGSITRRKRCGDSRLGVSTSSFVAVSIAVLVVSSSINWYHSVNLLLRYDEQNSNDAGNHDFFRPSNIVSISNNINNKTIEEFPHLTATVERDRTRHKKRNSGENLVEAEKKVSEKNKNFNSDSPSKLDTEHLKTAYVYKPGPWDGAGIVIKEYKLVFFTQGKVACTVFKQLFRRMMHRADWRVDNTRLPHNPGKNGLTYLYHYNVSDALEALTHPEWTRAIFVRDPKERILSAFLDKAARKKGQYVRRHCCNEMNATCGEEASASLLSFLHIIEDSCCCDPHWRPQTQRIDKEFMPFVNFVGHFDRIQEDTKRLLDRLTLRNRDDIQEGVKTDLWTIFGANGWGNHANESIFSKDAKAKHRTSAITKLRQYYNATSEALVEKIFADDYADPLLNLRQFSVF